jgi:hypothetical protein
MLAPAEDPAAKVFEWPLLTGALARGHAIRTETGRPAAARGWGCAQSR